MIAYLIKMSKKSREYLLSQQQSAKYRYIFQDSELRKGDVEDSSIHFCVKSVRLLVNLLCKMITNYDAED